MTAIPAAAGATTSGGTLYVRTTGVDAGTCRFSTHPCATIAYAVSKATLNSTINVGAGSFPQQLAISQSLTIQGVAGHTVISPTSLANVDTDPIHGTATYPIVDVTGGASVTLENLVINGSNAQAQFTAAASCANDPIGVYFHNASGHLTDDSVTNIAEGAPTNGGIFGCQSGIAVFAASDTGTSNVTMTSDHVSGYQKDGVACRGANTSCTVTESTVTGVGSNPYQGANGIEIYGASHGTVTRDTVSANSYSSGGASNQATGLLLLDDGTLNASYNTLSGNDINAYLGSDGGGPTEGAWAFKHNTVKGATDNVAGGQSQYGDGVDIDGTSNAVSVAENTVTLSAENGISLTGAENAIVTDNITNANKANGIDLTGPAGVWGPPATAIPESSHDQVTYNHSENNLNDGILADAASSSNGISHNVLVSNHHYDLEDAGTGNTWAANSCTPSADSSPAGLCG